MGDSMTGLMNNLEKNVIFRIFARFISTRNGS